MKIFLVDKKNDIIGHYHIMKCLSRLEATIEIDTTETSYAFKKFPFRFIKERFRIVRHVIEQTYQRGGENTVIHFLTADKFYFLFWLFPGKLKGHKIVATIHRFPENRILQKILVLFSQRIDSILVLSDYLKHEMDMIGVKRVVAVQHPTFYDYSGLPSKAVLRKRFGIEDKKIVFSFLGGTRHEKGMDIFLDALEHLSKEEKKSICILIAGAPLDFQSDFVSKRISNIGVDTCCRLKRLTDTEFLECVKVTDYLVLPYRNSFNAMSGPLSEAFSQNIGCILPDRGIFRFYGEMQDSNMMFEGENAQSLANAISYCLKYRPSVPVRVSKIFQTDTFLEGVNNLYQNLITQ